MKQFKIFGYPAQPAVLGAGNTSQARGSSVLPLILGSRIWAVASLLVPKLHLLQYLVSFFLSHAQTCLYSLKNIQLMKDWVPEEVASVWEPLLQAVRSSLNGNPDVWACLALGPSAVPSGCCFTCFFRLIVVSQHLRYVHRFYFWSLSIRIKGSFKNSSKN